MNKRFKIGLGIIGGFFVAVGLAFAVLTHREAHRLITNPVLIRSMPRQTPADYGLAYTDVSVTNSDGLKLVGWYIPSKNRAVVMAQHGYKSCRGEMLPTAAVLNRHGYGVLISSIRGHDGCGGEQITFGFREMPDLDAWYQYLLTRQEIDPERIGALGRSLGGSLVIQYAAQNPRIKVVIANSAFSSVSDTVSTSITHFTGLPAFPFAPVIVFWAEKETGLRISQLDAKTWVKQIQPRPLLLMQGGADQVVSPRSGELLFAEAGEPKEFWYEPSIGHVMFETKFPEEYEKRVVGFLDKHLLNN
jgi:fermentation-respiration switch protein FrsA (DUF1100 family)